MAGPGESRQIANAVSARNGTKSTNKTAATKMSTPRLARGYREARGSASLVLQIFSTVTLDHGIGLLLASITRVLPGQKSFLLKTQGNTGR